MLSAASIKRHGKVGVKGEVFGVDPTLVAQRWPAAVDQGPVSRRRSCLPAVALRCVDYREWFVAARSETGSSDPAFIQFQLTTGLRKKKVFSGYQEEVLMSLSSESSLTAVSVRCHLYQTPDVEKATPSQAPILSWLVAILVTSILMR